MKHVRQIRVVLEFASTVHREPRGSAVEDRETLATRQSGAIPDSIHIDMLLIDGPAQWVPGRVISGMRGIRS